MKFVYASPRCAALCLLWKGRLRTSRAAMLSAHRSGCMFSQDTIMILINTYGDEEQILSIFLGLSLSHRETPPPRVSSYCSPPWSSPRVQVGVWWVSGELRLRYTQTAWTGEVTLAARTSHVSLKTIWTGLPVPLTPPPPIISGRYQGILSPSFSSRAAVWWRQQEPEVLHVWMFASVSDGVCLIKWSSDWKRLFTLCTILCTVSDTVIHNCILTDNITISYRVSEFVVLKPTRQFYFKASCFLIPKCVVFLQRCFGSKPEKIPRK